MQTWIAELRQLGPQNLVLAIAGNKVDLESTRQVGVLREESSYSMISLSFPSLPSIQVAVTAGENFAKNADAIFLETSAKENINVHELFKAIGEPRPFSFARLGTQQSTRLTMILFLFIKEAVSQRLQTSCFQ